MLKSIIQSVKRLMPQPTQVDPSRFNDPLAERTEWTPLKSGGSNFRTHRLVEPYPGRLEFRISFWAFFFGGIFLLVGVGIMVAGLAAGIAAGKIGFNLSTFGPVLLGAIFGGVGGLALWTMTKPTVFDTQSGFYWKGRVGPEVGYGTDQPKNANYAPLEDIHAIQLISEYCRSDKNSYYSYEMNLVLNDGRRLNVIDHGNCDSIRRDAQRLSDFLSRPVWDAI
ncbi:MAG: hypothetical protein ACP5HU_06260 [Phycisphaerae bacterium]